MGRAPSMALVCQGASVDEVLARSRCREASLRRTVREWATAGIVSGDMQRCPKARRLRNPFRLKAAGLFTASSRHFKRRTKH